MIDKGIYNNCPYPNGSERFFKVPVPGAIAPVDATEDMTQPVGLRDNQLFTSNTLSSIAPDFSMLSTYEANELVVYEGFLYKAKHHVGMGAFDPEDWTKLKISDEIYRIDDKISQVDNTIGENAIEMRLHWGKSGNLVLSVSDWNDNVMTKEVTGLRDDDTILIAPESRQDRDLMSGADIFATSSGNIVTFTCGTTPIEPIRVIYYILRGE